MSYRLALDRPIAEELRRAAREQIRRGLSEIADPGLGPHETVHQVRKRCKKIRGLLRLARPALAGDAYSDLNGFFRDAARMLSDVRDAQAVRETYDDLMDAYGDQVDRRAFAPVRRRMTLDLAAIENADVVDRLDRFRRRMERADSEVPTWPLEVDGFGPLRKGLRRTWRRGVDGLASAAERGSVEDLHEWRKRTKYHWYHCRLLRDLWRPVMEARIEQTHRLSDLLGDHHDLAVLREHLAVDPDRWASARDLEVLDALAVRGMDRLEAEALTLGRRLYTDSPKALGKRLESWYGAALDELEHRPEA